MRHAEILASLLLGVATVLLFLWLAFMPSGSEENRLAKRPAQSTKSPIPTEGPQARRIQLDGTSLSGVRRPAWRYKAGFAKADDLAFFLRRIGDIDYVHEPLLAPTDQILKAYKKEKGDWRAYEKQFLRLMSDRQIENRFTPERLDGACLLCSEATPHQCHRRLVCEYLNEKWPGMLEVRHL
jgi:Protein of unknown function, DUF488